MARTNDDWPPIRLVIVISVGVLVALGWALPRVLHALGEMIALIVRASTVGVATAAPIAGWVAPVAGAGIAATGAGTIIVVLVKAAREAAKEPYEWTVPLLAILAGLLLDLAKGYGLENELLKAILTAVIALLVVVAGACWKTEDWRWKTVAVALLLLPPTALLIQSLEASGARQLITSFENVPRLVWFRVGGFLSIGVGIAVLHALKD